MEAQLLKNVDLEVGEVPVVQQKENQKKKGFNFRDVLDCLAAMMFGILLGTIVVLVTNAGQVFFMGPMEPSNVSPDNPVTMSPTLQAVVEICEEEKPEDPNCIMNLRVILVDYSYLFLQVLKKIENKKSLAI